MSFSYVLLPITPFHCYSYIIIHFEDAYRCNGYVLGYLSVIPLSNYGETEFDTVR